jgi:hypothetical protein
MNNDDQRIGRMQIGARRSTGLEDAKHRYRVGDD